MGSVVVQMGISLDGFMAGPDGEIDWHLLDEEMSRHVDEELRGAAAFFQGRGLYEDMEGYWATAGDAPGASAHHRDFAATWRKTPKVVYSRTLEPADLGPNAELERDVVPGDVRARLAELDGPVWVGGALLAAAFAEHDLVDEYRLFVHPVLIGRGRPAFPPVDRRTSLRLLETRAFGNGVVLLRHGRG